MIFSNCSNCCTPLISTTPPPSIETFTSCLIVPIPLATFFVTLSSLPSVNAIFLTKAGSPDTGSNAIYVGLDVTASATTGIKVNGGETLETQFPIDFRDKVAIVAAAGTPA